MTFFNVYCDAVRSAAYARLEFSGTYYLAYRDLPAIIERHVRGRRAIDFGCGTGRSTRFLRGLEFETIGVDIAEEMVQAAGSIDPTGDYRRIEDGGLRRFPRGAYDLVLSAFAFDNIPSLAARIGAAREIAERLAPDGRFINVVSAPEIYVHEWASFSTRNFPENRRARSGDPVRITITDIDDPRPVEDVVCHDADYKRIYARAGLSVLETHRPLGSPDEGYEWVSETRVPPWAIYVLGPDR